MRWGNTRQQGLYAASKNTNKNIYFRAAQRPDILEAKSFVSGRLLFLVKRKEDRPS